jgi:signal transduction histidine kinase
MAQNPEADSLNRLLKTAPEDTSKVMMYWKTGAAVIYQDPQGAVPYFKKGTALAAKLSYISGLERCNNATSFAFSLNAKYDSALVYINYAVPYAVKVGDIKRLSLVYLNRADIYSNLNNYSAALKDCDTSIRYAEKMGNNADALARIYSIIAGVYVDQGKYDEAEINMDKSLLFFEKAHNRRLVAQIYSDKADLWLRREKPARALPLLRTAIAIGDSLQDLENLSAYYGSLTEAFVRMKQYEEARGAASKAMSLSKQTDNTRQQGTIYDYLYHIEFETNNITAAIENGLKAFTIFKDENDLLRQQSAATSLSEAYFKINNHAQAYKYLKISRDLNDSLMRQQFSNETIRLQTTFEVKEKDKAIQLLNIERELQNQRMKQQRLLLFGAVALALLAIMGIWLLMNRNKLRQRMKELELRNQIAADLHDEVGSSLSSIHMLSQMATQRTTEAAQQDILSRMSTNAKETMDKMGDIVWMIKPGETEGGSLKQRMERFAYEIGASKNMEVAIQLEELEKVKLTMEQRKNIYLIFKEAVNNAAKYSGTKSITIDASLQNKELLLLIKDEGQGFDSHRIKKGNGLDNMRNRAKELGAVLDIQSASDAGTAIQLALPVS